MFVMGGAVLLNIVTFNTILKQDKPFIEDEYKISKRTDIDLKLIIGSGIFGLGWGLGGLCPGPVLVLIGTT